MRLNFRGSAIPILNLRGEHSSGGRGISVSAPFEFPRIANKAYRKQSYNRHSRFGVQQPHVTDTAFIILSFDKDFALFPSMEEDGFSWTTGTELGVRHLQKIASGSYGEVHKVFLQV